MSPCLCLLCNCCLTINWLTTRFKLFCIRTCQFFMLNQNLNVFSCSTLCLRNVFKPKQEVKVINHNKNHRFRNSLPSLQQLEITAIFSRLLLKTVVMLGHLRSMFSFGLFYIQHALIMLFMTFCIMLSSFELHMWAYKSLLQPFHVNHVDICALTSSYSVSKSFSL